jgi:hypothetical protein
MVKILDLGLARFRDEEGHSELTAPDRPMGTMDYLAPEQADLPHEVDIRADIYSLGCTLFHLLMGHPPYRDFRTGPQKIHAHAHVPLPALDESIPGPLGEIVRRMTAKKREERFDRPEEVEKALEPFANLAELEHLFYHSPGLGPSEAVDVKDGSTVVEKKGTTPPGKQTLISSFKRNFLFCAVGLCILAGVIGTFFGLKGLNHPGSQLPPGHENDSNTANGELDPLWVTSELRQLDQLPPFRQHDLLDRRPDVLLWGLGAARATKVYDPREPELFVTTNRSALFRLGEVYQPNYKFQVRIFQPNWDGSPGLFLGFHPENPSRFQCFYFYGPKCGLLKRGFGKIVTREEVIVETEEEMCVPLKPPVGPPLGEQVLEIVVQKFDLTKVMLNGHEIKELALPIVNSKFGKADYQGGLGTFHIRNSAHFRRAYFQLFPDTKLELSTNPSPPK